MSAPRGRLEVNLLCAQLRDVRTFGRQDPYVVLQIGTTRQRSRTATDGHTRPHWNERISLGSISAGGDPQVLCEVYDECVGKDELIGGVIVTLQRAIANGIDDVRAPLRTRDGKPAGELQLILKWEREGGAAPAPAHQPAGGWPAAAGMAAGGAAASGYPPAAAGGYPPPAASGYPPPPASGYPPPAASGYPPPPASGYPPPAASAPGYPPAHGGTPAPAAAFAGAAMGAAAMGAAAHGAPAGYPPPAAAYPPPAPAAYPPPAAAPYPPAAAPYPPAAAPYPPAAAPYPPYAPAGYPPQPGYAAPQPVYFPPGHSGAMAAGVGGLAGAAMGAAMMHGHGGHHPVYYSKPHKYKGAKFGRMKFKGGKWKR